MLPSRCLVNVCRGGLAIFRRAFHNYRLSVKTIHTCQPASLFRSANGPADNIDIANDADYLYDCVHNENQRLGLNICRRVGHHFSNRSTLFLSSIRLVALYSLILKIFFFVFYLIKRAKEGILISEEAARFCPEALLFSPASSKERDPPLRFSLSLTDYSSICCVRETRSESH